MPTFLIQTVGGRPEPLAFSLVHHRPDEVVFVTSDKTAADVDEGVLPACAASGFALAPGAYRCLMLTDFEDLEVSAEDIAVSLVTEVD